MITLSAIVCLLSFAYPSYMAIASKDYKENPLHNDKIFTDSLVFEHPSGSLVHCTSLCGPDCVYYGFNFKEKKCRVHNCNLLSNSVQESGWKYYALDLDAKPKDCQTLKTIGHKCSGVYTIYPAGSKGIDVVCDMETMGGGWTIIQNRFDGSETFNRNWNDYKSGFGRPTGEYWIGNDVIHELTNTSSSSLYISITLTNGTTLFEMYETFSISSELYNYRLYIAGPASGALGDQMILQPGSVHANNGMMFSTKDRDNDQHHFQSFHCAYSWNGGWWFNACSLTFLNGPYGSSSWSYPWSPFTGEMIKKTSMMIRRR